MEYIELGNTGIKVSKMCFGGLTIGPLQANLSIEEGSNILIRAMELGVNFVDTAELYGTYLHIREAMKKTGKKPVIATKSYAYNLEGARKSLEKARRELDIDYIDIFLLHEQESRLTLRGHREALEYYLECKEKGLIKKIGVSTHNIEVVEACAQMPEIDIIHPIINKTGIGIGDGTINEMLIAVEKAYGQGKGIYSMKPLGGGNLLNSVNECFDFVLNIPFIHSIALGMQSIDEVEINVRIFENKEIPIELLQLIKNKNRKLHIDFWCAGCGKCVERCKQKALILEEGKVRVIKEKCVLCGYCGSVCKEFAIKIF